MAHGHGGIGVASTAAPARAIHDQADRLHHQAIDIESRLESVLGRIRGAEPRGISDRDAPKPSGATTLQGELQFASEALARAIGRLEDLEGLI